MSDSILAAIIALLGVLVTQGTGYLLVNRRDVSDRQVGTWEVLSREQLSLRESLREEIRALKEECEGLEEKIGLLRLQVEQAHAQLERCRRSYGILELRNKELLAETEWLRAQLRGLRPSESASLEGPTRD